MIGDRERPDDESVTPSTDFGPLDAMVRLSPPADAPGIPPAWVERYDRVVVVRHTYTDGDVTREMFASSVAVALHAYAREVGRLRARGYTPVAE